MVKSKIWSYALAGALAVSNLSGVVATPFTTLVSHAAYIVEPTVVMTGTNGILTVTALPRDYNGTDGIYIEPYATNVVLAGKYEVQPGCFIELRETTPLATTSPVKSEAVSGDTAVTKTVTMNIDVDSEVTRTYKLVYIADDDTQTETELDTISVNLVERKTLTEKKDFNGKVTMGDAASTIYAGNTTGVGIEATLAAIDAGEFIDDAATFELVANNDEDPITVGGDAVEFEYAGIVGSALEIPATITATKEGSYTVDLVYDADGNGDAEGIVIASKAYTVVDASIKSIDVTEADNTSKVLNKAIGDATTSLDLTAVATADDVSGLPSALTWKVFSADDTEYESEISELAPTAGSNVVSPSKKTLTSKATISALNAPAGSYVAVAYKEGDASAILTPVGTYSFEVVGVPTTAKVEIVNDVKNGDFYEGSTGKAKLYLDGMYKNEYTSATFKLVTPSDSQYVDLKSDGTFTVLKKKSSAVKVTLDSYTTEDGVELTASDLSVTQGTITVEDSTFSISATPTLSGSIPLGAEYDITAKYGINTVNATYTSSNVQYITVDDNGHVKAVAITPSTVSVEISAKYVVDGETVGTETISGLKVVSPSYYLTRIENGRTVGIIDTDSDSGYDPESVRPGKSFDIRLAQNNGKDITDTITWEVENPAYGAVSGSGAEVTVSVPASAKAGKTTLINAYVGDAEEPSVTFAVEVADAVWTAEADEKAFDTPSYDSEGVVRYTVPLYNTETLTLKALYDDEEVSGKWIISKTAANTGIVLSGNVVKATSSLATSDNFVWFIPDGTDDAMVIIEIPTLEDGYVLYQDGKDVDDSDDSSTGIQVVLNAVEVGENFKFTVKNGAKDVTNNLTWTSNNKAVSVSNGAVTVDYEASASGSDPVATITAKDGTTVIAEIKIGEILAHTGAAEDAAVATEAATTASDKADAAVEAAEAAKKAAEETKSTPTAENLAKAEEALETANANLTAAQSALEEAEAALEKANADGAESETAQDAVVKARIAVVDAKDAVANAEKAVASAQATFDEAASEVEKAKKAAEEEKKQQEEQKAAEEKAAAQKEGATGTDATANANFTVTSTADKTVAYTAPATKAKKVTIPSTVTVGGDTFTVTEIAANAFKNDKTVTTITIPASIKKINSNAFKNAKNLKTIKIQGAKLEKVSKNAFNGIKKNAKIKVSGANKKANKKLLKKTTAVKKGNVKVK